MLKIPSVYFFIDHPIFMEGVRLLMNKSSLMPLRTQSCSEERMVMSSLRKWWLFSRACWSMADLYSPSALPGVEGGRENELKW